MPDFWTRMKYAFHTFLSLLIKGELPEEVARALLKPHPVPTDVTPATISARSSAVGNESADGAVQALALLQRDGRLIDFLSEDIAPYPDTQLGAAVRTVHENCKQVMNRYFKLEPILDSEEDQPITVQPGFDASAVKLIGNITGEPPIRGILRHRGWRVKETHLPSLPQEPGRMVVAPAEVEVP